MIEQRAAQEMSVAYKMTFKVEERQQQSANLKNASLVTVEFKHVICLQIQGDGLCTGNTHLRGESVLEFAVEEQTNLGATVSWRVGSERYDVGTGSADCKVPVVGV